MADSSHDFYVACPLAIFPAMMFISKTFLASMVLFLVFNQMIKGMFMPSEVQHGPLDLLIGGIIALFYMLITHDIDRGMDFLCGCCMADLFVSAIGILVAMVYSFVKRKDVFAFLNKELYNSETCEEEDRKYLYRILPLVPYHFIRAFQR